MHANKLHHEIKGPTKALLWWVAGQRALAAVARAVDGRGPQTDLVAAACKHCRVEHAEDLLGCVRHAHMCICNSEKCCPHEVGADDLGWHVTLEMGQLHMSSNR